MTEAFFVDLDGNIIYDVKIASHIGLAKNIVEKNPVLLEEFKNSGEKYEDSFLVNEKGYCSVTNLPYNKFLVINKEKATKKQKVVLYSFVQEGFKFYFVDKAEDINITMTKK